MSTEKKADVDAMLAEVEHEIHLAIKQGVITDQFQWSKVIKRETDGEPFMVILTIGHVAAQPTNGK